MSTYLPTLQDIVMVQTFIKGLKLEIQFEISKEHLVGLCAIKDVALHVQKCLKALWEA